MQQASEPEAGAGIGRLGVWAHIDPLPRSGGRGVRPAARGVGLLGPLDPRGGRARSVQRARLPRGAHAHARLATGIANIYARDAMTMRATQKTLAELSGGRFVLGLGVSHEHLVTGVRGHEYEKPVATMRAYLEAMEKALYLGRAAEGGRADRARGAAPAHARARAREGARRASLLRAAGAHGARPRDPRPRTAGCAPSRWCCSRRDASKARAVARQHMQIYTTLPNYQNNLRELGFGDADFADGGSDRLVDAIVAWGDEKAIAARIQAHHDAGADHVCIQPLPARRPAGARTCACSRRSRRARARGGDGAPQLLGLGARGRGPERGAGARHRPHARRALRAAGSARRAGAAPREHRAAGAARGGAGRARGSALEHALRSRLPLLREVLPRHRARRARRVPASARSRRLPAQRGRRRRAARLVRERSASRRSPTAAARAWWAASKRAISAARGAISIDLGRLDRVLEIDRSRARRASRRASSAPRSRTSCARTGSRCATSRNRSSSRASAAGSSRARAATTRRSTRTSTSSWKALRVVTPTGSVETRRLPGSGAGPNPDRLFIGSEGTLGIVIEAWMRLQQRPRFRASASVRFGGEHGFLRGRGGGARASRSRACTRRTAGCSIRSRPRTPGAAGGDAAILVLGFESADHALDAWMARALELCRDGGGETPEGGARTRSGDEGAREGAAGAWRNAFLNAPYLRDVLVRAAVISETFETAITWDRFEEFHAGRDAGDARRRRPRVRQRQRRLPLHARLSRRPGALLHRARARPPRQRARAVGSRSRRPRARRCSRRAAPSPTTTPSDATIGPGTTASGRTPSRGRCARPSASSIRPAC